MRKIVRVIYYAAVIALSLTSAATGQESCKVLKVGIDSAYLGSCKKDLAHGIGEAWGRDHYYGEFRKGLPSGKGVYEYMDGSVYNGNFVKGFRQGEGEYTFRYEGADTVLSGMWERDRYIGPKDMGPGYKIIRQENIERFKVSRMGDNEKVVFRFMSVSSANPEISNVFLSSSSGSEFRYTGFYGFENIKFPFTARTRYQKWNKMATNRLEVIFEIEILRPGEWKIELY